MFFLASFMLFLTTSALGLEQASVGELFTFKIQPAMFNWTHQGLTEQFRYRPSLEGYPDLPSWMRYMYSKEYHCGYLYGSPPERLAGQRVGLDIVALNKQNYQTRRVVLEIFVASKMPAPNVVQMRIENLNWVHLMDPGRVENLKNIFRKDLWLESDRDLHLVFMESAVNMGGRVPLRPQQREGVIVHVGSATPFSERLKELQEEVRPLYKLATCPYKRTSVQKLFEDAGFKLDWCGFKIVGNDISPEVLYHNHGAKGSEGRRNDRWHGISKEDVPQRNYIDEFAFAFAIPGMIFAVLLASLSAVFCFQGEPYEATPHAAASTVQMVQCSDTNNQPTTTLKSLTDPHLLLDNLSLHSQSPNTSLIHSESPTNTYLRPKPPPYKASSLGKTGVDI